MSNIYTDPPQSRNEAIIKSTIDGTQYTDPPQSRMEDLLLDLKEAIEGGGGGGTTVVANPEGEATDELEKLQVGSDIYGISKDYEEMSNKPQINGETLSGNKTASELGLQVELDGAQTVSGNPITVTDAEPMNAEGVIVELEPKQDLHGYDAPWVGGAGKNKCESFVATSATGQYAVALYIETELQPSTQYAISFDDIANNGYYSNENVFTEYMGITTVNGRNSIIVTTKDDLGKNGATYEDGKGWICLKNQVEQAQTPTIDRVQLEQGSTATTYAPYSNICPISGYSEVNVERVGVNLLNLSQVELFNQNRYVQFKENEYLSVKPNTTYTLSYKYGGGDGKVYGYDVSGNITTLVEHIPYNPKYVTFTTASDTVKIAFYSLVSADGSISLTDVEIQLELGSTATTYEPYQDNTYTIDLDGTKYGGTLDVTEGGYSDEWGYISGSSVSDLGATIGTTSAGTLYVSLGEVSLLTDADTTPTRDQLQCNELCNKATNDIWYNNKSGVTCDAYGIVFFTVKDITTQADMDTWLSNNPIQIAYRKKTPSSVSTTPTDIPLLENTNNISTDGTNITLKYQPNNVIGECKAYTDEQIEKVLPPLPTTDGTYHLSCEVTSGVGVLSWVSDS